MQPIRLARIADAAEIAAMSRDQIEQGLGWSWNEARVRRAIESPDTNVAVLGDSGKLSAFGIMVYRDEIAHLMLFSVRPEQRRRGLGRNLLHWLEAVARTAGIPRISLECRLENGPARNFYADQGYHEMAIHKGYYRGVEDAVRLEKWLMPTEK